MVLCDLSYAVLNPDAGIACNPAERQDFILYFGVMERIGHIGLKNPAILSYASCRSYRSYAEMACTLPNTAYMTI